MRLGGAGPPRPAPPALLPPGGGLLRGRLLCSRLLRGRLARGLLCRRGRGGDRRVDDGCAGSELLHRRAAAHRGPLRLVRLTRRNDLAVGREEREAELPGRALLDDELSWHVCLSFRGRCVRCAWSHARRKSAPTL